MSKNMGNEFLSIRMTPSFAEIGPHVIHKKTACFKCLDYRFKANIPFFKSSTANLQTDLKNEEIHSEITADFASLEILNILTKNHSAATGNVLSIDFRNLDISIDPVLKIPTCPVCFGRIL